LMKTYSGDVVHGPSGCCIKCGASFYDKDAT
jgi:hypothetical protein